MRDDCLSRASLLIRYAAALPALLHALRSDVVMFAGLRLRIPGPLSVRTSVLAGNTRVCALIDAVVRPGATVVDVGANIGFTTAYAALRVGPSGRVIAVEPAADNLVVLHENVSFNHLSQVSVHEGAAGRARESRPFYLRGDLSAVNSLFPESCYATVTAVSNVEVSPLDDLLEGEADLVKIDVEGAELEVLAGMPRLLENRRVHLVVEWHPLLQQAAGYAAGALPLALIDAGFRLDAVGHLSSRPLRAGDVPDLAERLTRSGRPVELVARR